MRLPSKHLARGQSTTFRNCYFITSVTPWPRAAEHAAEALVALNCQGAIPQLAAMYDLPDPTAPFRVLSTSSTQGSALPPGTPNSEAVTIEAAAVVATLPARARQKKRL